MNRKTIPTINCEVSSIVPANRVLSTRAEYGRTLVRLGERSRDLMVLDADLSGSTGTAAFAKRFPNRFFNMGISEQDLVCTAAGMSLAGKITFVSSFAIFATGRCWEQIRNAVALPGCNRRDPQGEAPELTKSK